MPLEMRKTSQWWYGRYNVNGKVHCTNLGIKIAGQRPDSISQEGDHAFERSRGKARQAFEEKFLTLKDRHSTERLVEKLYEIRTGHKVPTIMLSDMTSAWKHLLREKPIQPRYAGQVASVFDSFVEFIRDNFPSVAEMAGLRHEMAIAFMQSEESRGISPRSWNFELTVLRSAFRQLRRQASIVDNPFEGIAKKKENTISRVPFSADELRSIVAAAQGDAFIRPIIITGICTAMRRGDCCLLKWADVDMRQRFISIKTMKTGKPAQIPMFPMLHDELRQALPAEGDYVFPAPAQMYRENPDGITLRVKAVLKAAGFSDDEKKKDAKQMTVKRKHGLRQASIRDFHSFRTTWVTMALSAGIPLELVRKVTGHKTVEVVLEHYFQPGREEFRQLIQTNMPMLLTNGQTAPEKSAKEQMLEVLEKMTVRTWKRDREKLRELLAAT